MRDGLWTVGCVRCAYALAILFPFPDRAAWHLANGWVAVGDGCMQTLIHCIVHTVQICSCMWQLYSCRYTMFGVSAHIPSVRHTHSAVQHIQRIHVWLFFMHENTVLLESFKKSLVFILMRNKQIYRMHIMLGHFPDCTHRSTAQHSTNKNLTSIFGCCELFLYARIYAETAAPTAAPQRRCHPPTVRIRKCD